MCSSILDDLSFGYDLSHLKCPVKLLSACLAMEKVESKDKLGDYPEYPKLKVMVSPDNDTEESGFEDEKFGAMHSESVNNNNEGDLDLFIQTKNAEFEPNSEAYQHGMGYGSLNGSQLGLASLVSSPTSNDNPTTQQFNPTAIDTKAPIESVKDAVSKYGGIVDWKAHKEQTAERRKFMEIELEKAQEEIPMFRKECEAAEEHRTQILKNLDSTNAVIEDMKLKLESEHIVEQQAKQDSDYAKLKVEEIEKGIYNGATVAAKAQLEVAKARHLAAISELKIVKDEFEKLQLEFSTLASDRDAAIKKAEEDNAISKELERKIEDLTIEIANTKGYLESAHAEHREEEEEDRDGKAMELNEEMLNLEKELKEAEEDFERIDNSPTRNLKSKFAAASALHQSLNDELKTYYMESDTNQEIGDVLHPTDKLEKLETKTHHDVLAAIESVKKELEKVNAHKEVRKALEETNQEKALASSMENRLLATQKEIEATKHFENYALITLNNEDSSNGVILSLEEYLELNQKAHEAKESETNSQQRLREINHEIIQRKKTLQIALEKAEIANQGKLQVEQQWGNMRAEYEQRRKDGEPVRELENVNNWEHDSIEKIYGQNRAPSYQQRSPRTTEAPTRAQTHTQSEIEANYKEILSLETSVAKKKKKSMFPKFWMFMGKKKSSS